MSSHEVIKPFATVNRRMKPGTPTHQDDHLEPYKFTDLVARGFIGVRKAVSEPLDVTDAPRTPMPPRPGDA